MEDYDPRVLVAKIGCHSDTRLESRPELQVLRLLLGGAHWCRWVDFKTVSTISSNLAEIDIVCSWLEDAEAEARLDAHDLLLTPRMLRIGAPRLLEIEAKSEMDDDFLPD
jgi:hypothetical protein